MAKARSIRDYTDSEKVNAVDELSEVFFSRLMVKADDHGAYYWNAKLLKSFLFPMREISEEEIGRRRDACIQAGLIEIYESEGKKYLWILNFGQRMRFGKKNKFPIPPQIAAIRGDSRNDGENLDSQTEVEVETEVETEVEDEGNRGKPSNKKKSVKVSFSESKYFDKEIFRARLIEENYSDVDFDRYYNSAKRYSTNNPNKKYVDWADAVMNWIDRDRSEASKNNQPPAANNSQNNSTGRINDAYSKIERTIKGEA